MKELTIKKGRKVVASIITSTPVKRQLEEKLEVEKQKEEAKRLKMLKRDKEKGTRNMKQSQPAITAENEETICPCCNERFEDPPTEDWIQCSQCLRWWHESCSDYEGVGAYTCDVC
ncbi:uncharacterized protein LOC108914548 [Anoplophora glabripennis]|uniref:uncharacterized protein LOC108914548 n=1 Tax=Anoplophora glabripennis TaxID=217634 RepID=UPI000874DD0F|nr:uncharacterized protein LOC108914548 [Anoplophora glabripennis]